MSSGSIAFLHRYAIGDRGVDGNETGIGVSGLTQKPRLLEAPHRRDLCHLHASQTGGQHVAVLTVNHDDNTQTSHRLHAIHPWIHPCPCSKTHTSIGGRRDRYILLLSVLFETTPAAPPTMGKSPDGETTNADVVFVHGRRCARCLLWSRVSRYAIAASCKSASVDLNSYSGRLISLDCDFRVVEA